MKETNEQFERQKHIKHLLQWCYYCEFEDEYSVTYDHCDNELAINSTKVVNLCWRTWQAAQKNAAQDRVKALVTGEMTERQLFNAWYKQKPKNWIGAIQYNKAWLVWQAARKGLIK